jgi:hypothetical protein
MNKTHISDSPITFHQYHNRQVTLCFCARLSVGHSAGSSTRTGAGRSDGSQNVVRFHPVKPKT